MIETRLPEREPVVLRNAFIMTMDEKLPDYRGDLFLADGIIQERTASLPSRCRELDCSDIILLPGFVQTHVHLCQSLFRGQADDLQLLPWLQQRIWPYEAALDSATMRLSALLGIAELIRSGTTCILDMGSVRHYDMVLDALAACGMRAIGGKCLMDDPKTVPPALLEKRSNALREADALGRRWHGFDNNRLRYALCPRFAISCTRGLIEDAAALAREHGYFLHTHASENRDEISLVQQRTGMHNIDYLHTCHFTGSDVVLAHCIWLNPNERKVLAKTDTAVAHCPGSNLKLASGIAPIVEYLNAGIRVGLGADGCPCNNNLDMFMEMRLASLLQKLQFGAESISAERVLRMATIDGARLLGLDGEIGTLVPGKKADVIGVPRRTVFNQPESNFAGELVYAGSGRDVVLTIIDGRVLMHNRELQFIDEMALIEQTNVGLRHVVERMETGTLRPG